jgi:hypothetical protein
LKLKILIDKNKNKAHLTKYCIIPIQTPININDLVIIKSNHIIMNNTAIVKVHKKNQRKNKGFCKYITIPKELHNNSHIIVIKHIHDNKVYNNIV